MYIVVRNSKIKMRFIGPKESLKDAYPDLKDDDLIHEVPNSFEGAMDDDIANFDENFILRPIEDRIADGLVTLRPEQKVDNGVIRYRTPEEMVEAGIMTQEQMNSMTNSFIDMRRKEAYAYESDPLFFKYQRGEITKEEWLAKVEEIKTRYPKVK